jgi:hypothetical protein
MIACWSNGDDIETRLATCWATMAAVRPCAIRARCPVLIQSEYTNLAIGPLGNRSSSLGGVRRAGCRFVVEVQYSQAKSAVSLMSSASLL